MISAVKRNVVGFSLYLFYEDIRIIKVWFEFLDYSHVRRSCNVVAHCVARWDINVGGGMVLTGPFPEAICDLSACDVS